MEIHERIRHLRKDHLKLSQTEFGERLGVSRSVITNIERNLLAEPEKKLPLYKLICHTFGVSEAWLINGTGDMYVHRKTFNPAATGGTWARDLVIKLAKLDDKDWEALQHIAEKLK